MWKGKKGFSFSEKQEIWSGHIGSTRKRDKTWANVKLGNETYGRGIKFIPSTHKYPLPHLIGCNEINFYCKFIDKPQHGGERSEENILFWRNFFAKRE